jgi:DNA (cytosine-5)-methyltransferase 1
LRIFVKDQPDKITGPWLLRDLREKRIGFPKNGLKVFTTFHCGGGSSMGYRLAGYDVVGGVEIDPDMMKLYRTNLSPREDASFQMPIQNFHPRDLPPDLHGQIDILDGSPPCSSFSMAGAREKFWGRSKVFREGQAKQILDDLFFHFISTAKAMQPKVVVAENVKGLIQGNARGYVAEIFATLNDAGYDVQLFLLNASRMGVPQLRERTFFIARRRDLNLPKLTLEFSEDPITVATACVGINEIGEYISGEKTRFDWLRTPPGEGFGVVGGFNSHKKLSPHKPAFTQTSSLRHYHWTQPVCLSDAAVVRLQGFPDDYDFCGEDPQYVCGMSVPPLMMQRVALEVARQWFMRSVAP